MDKARIPYRLEGDYLEVKTYNSGVVFLQHTGNGLDADVLVVEPEQLDTLIDVLTHARNQHRSRVQLEAAIQEQIMNAYVSGV